MNTTHIAYLLFEPPPDGDARTYQEIAALRGQGVTVTPFSILPARPSAQSAIEAGLQVEPDHVCGNVPRVLLGFAHMLERHPLRSLLVLMSVCRDLIAERSSSGSRKLESFGQAIAGLSLSPRLEAAGVSHLHAEVVTGSAGVGRYAARGAEITYSIAPRGDDAAKLASSLCEALA